MLKVDFPEAAPSICFVCTTASENEDYVDTLRDFEAQVVTSLSGRKYVCASCVTTMADALDVFAPMKEKVEAAEARVKEIEGLLDTYAKLQDILDTAAAKRKVTVEIRGDAGKIEPKKAKGA